MRCPVEDRVQYASWVDEDEYLYYHLVVYFAGIAASERYTSANATGSRAAGVRVL